VNLVRRRGSLLGEDPGDLVLLTPADAGWSRAGLLVVALAPGVPRTVRTGESEMFVLPLAGSLVAQIAPEQAPDAVEAAYELAGRSSVFTRVTDFGYAGRDSLVTLTSDAGAEVALPSAVCASRRPPAYGPA
jgi:5-deoxy-glucuronate isomerase